MFYGVGWVFFFSLLAFVLCSLFLVSSSRLCLATSYRWCFFGSLFLLMTWESGLGWASWRCDIRGIFVALVKDAMSYFFRPGRGFASSYRGEQTGCSGEKVFFSIFTVFTSCCGLAEQRVGLEPTSLYPAEDEGPPVYGLLLT
jgi:hypothetical protein